MLYLLIVIFNHKIIIHYLKLLPEKIKILNFQSEYKKNCTKVMYVYPIIALQALWKEHISHQP